MIKSAAHFIQRFPCGFFLLIFLAIACTKKQAHTKPEFGNVTEAVYASARIKAESQYTVFPVQSGTLRKVLVQAGDTVKPDQVLFQLDDQAPELNSENARLAVELSEENARSGSAKNKEMETALRLAKEKLDLDSDLLKRQKALWAQGVGSKADLDQRQMAVHNSRSNVIASQSRLDQAKSQLKNDLARARNLYKISRKQSKDFMIRSAQKGMVFDVLKKEGELVNPQTAMAIVGNPGRFIIEMEVDQTDITRIEEGQPVSVTMDSYRGQVFEATVSKIHPIMDEKTRTLKVEALFRKAPPSLFPNLTAEANIVISNKKNTLTIPANYLVDGQYVWVGKDEKRKVTTGLKDDRKVEILSGLDSSTVIYKP